MTPREHARITAVALTLTITALIFATPARAEELVYSPTPPPGIAEMAFPEKWSHFDASGALWAFWREDDTVYYTDAADPSTLDFTTGYKDYFYLPHTRRAVSTIEPPLGPQLGLLAGLALASALGALLIRLLSGIGAGRDGVDDRLSGTPGPAPPCSS